MAGLQGSGKTTACGKLARLLKEDDGKALRLALYYDRDDALRDSGGRQDAVTAREE